MYWSEQGLNGTNPSIKSAHLDGSNPRAIVVDNLETPAGLEIDYTERRLYWVDTQQDSIESIGLDGRVRKRQKLPASDQPREIYDFAVFQVHLKICIGFESEFKLYF